MTQKNFKAVGIGAFQNEGDSVEGLLDDMQPNDFGGQVALIRVESGDIVRVNLNTVLENKFEQGGVTVGRTIRITYKGEKYSEKSRRTYKDYTLEVAEE